MSVIFEQATRHICKIILNRPSKRNAINEELFRGLRSAIERFENDDSLHVAILAGSNGYFCSGYDLNTIVDQTTGRPKLNELKSILWPIGTRLSDNKITIAAIEGHAVGFGYELALKCDFRVSDKDARMGFLNRRFGIPIMNGGTVILPKLIGSARAAELVATGRAQLSPEALQFGVINYMSDIGCAIGRATNLARCIVKFDQVGLRNDLKSLYYSTSEGQKMQVELLKAERNRSLEYLSRCEPLKLASRFLRGELCRHGSTDLGNIIKAEPEVTL